ncbi:hydroxyethylthiazole kinase [Alkalibacterium sp. m-11]|uniref:Hydroxyethylthiazole kinase n=1 Tax=Alkalibacterium indicireducens TaxID=398758 RepID=A0ABP3K7Q8_9LACT
MNSDHAILHIKDQNPLVHTITNQVVANDVANVLLAIGASPIMAIAKEEVEEVTGMAEALVINMGTLTSDSLESMILAGRQANAQGKPVILDPVGVGATTFRKQSAQKLFENVDMTVIRGNASEIASLVGVSWQSKGVDSKDEATSPVDVAVSLAKKRHCIVAVSGKTDIVTDGTRVFAVSNGDQLMAKITGSGCMMSGIIGAFLGVVDESDMLSRVVLAHAAFGIAGERAADSNINRPGSFRAALIDVLHSLTDDDLTKHTRIERIIQ